MITDSRLAVSCSSVLGQSRTTSWDLLVILVAPLNGESDLLPNFIIRLRCCRLGELELATDLTKGVGLNYMNIY